MATNNYLYGAVRGSVSELEPPKETDETYGRSELSEDSECAEPHRLTSPRHRANHPWQLRWGSTSDATSRSLTDECRPLYSGGVYPRRTT